MNKTYIKALAHAELYKHVGDGMRYMEAPRLLFDFRIGNVCRVGSVNTRTFGNDWWQTTPIVEIISIEDKDNRKAIKFKTRSGSFYTLLCHEDDIQSTDDTDTLSMVDELARLEEKEKE